MRAIIVDEHGTILAANQAWAERGKTVMVEDDLVVGDDFFANIRANCAAGADHRFGAARAFEEVARGLRPRHVELFPGGADGERTEQITAIHLGETTLISVVDVTDLVEARLSAARSQTEADWLWVVARSIDAAVLICDGNDVVEWVNDAYERHSGYARSELIGRTTSAIRLERGIRFSDPNFGARVRAGESVHVLSEGWTRDDRWIAESHQLAPVLDAQGGLQRIVIVSRDITDETVAITDETVAITDETVAITDETVAITDETVAAREAERERQLLASLIDNLPVALFWLDTTGTYRGCNQAYADHYGYEGPSVVVGQTVAELHPERAAEYLAADEETLRSSEAALDFEVTSTLPDGTACTMMSRKVALRNHDGDVTGVLGVLWDITERRQLEERLAQAGRMEAIGNLAAGVAHEINTRLQYLADNIEFLDASAGRLLALAEAVAELDAAGSLPAELKEPLRQARLDFVSTRIPTAFEQSNEGIAAVSTIVKAMKQTVHHQSGVRCPMDLNAAVESSVVLTRNQWKYFAELDLDLDPEMPLVSAFAGELKQVLLNMIINAAHAISDRQAGGDDRPGHIVVRTRATATTAEIRIGDNGCGIAAENRDRIFDLFFTTKEVGRGTGQGLSLAQSCIVGRHGGEIAIDTEVGVGTTFVLTLPLDTGGGSSLDEAALDEAAVDDAVHDGLAPGQLVAIHADNVG